MCVTLQLLPFIPQYGSVGTAALHILKRYFYISYSVLECKNRRFIFCKVEVASGKKINLKCNKVCMYSNTRP